MIVSRQRPWGVQDWGVREGRGHSDAHSRCIDRGNAFRMPRVDSVTGRDLWMPRVVVETGRERLWMPRVDSGTGGGYFWMPRFVSGTRR